MLKHLYPIRSKNGRRKLKSCHLLLAVNLMQLILPLCMEQGISGRIFPELFPIVGIFCNHWRMQSNRNLYWLFLVDLHVHWLRAQGGYNGQSYFGDSGRQMIGMLNNNYHLHHDLWGSDCARNWFRQQNRNKRQALCNWSNADMQSANDQTISKICFRWK